MDTVVYTTAVYLRDRIIAYGLERKTPYKVWTKTKLKNNNFKNFCSKVIVYVAEKKRQNWYKKSTEYILVGYPRNKIKNRIILSYFGKK